MDQGLYTRQDLQLRQEQTLAPQQIQSLEILLAPLLDLQMRVNQEMQSNPALERLDSEGNQLAGDPVESLDSPPENDALAGAAAERDEFLASIMQAGGTWQDYLPPAHAKHYASSDDEERRRYFFDSLTSEASLQDELLEQLRTEEIPPEDFARCELIVGSLDEAGYLRSRLEDLAQATGASMADMRRALKLVQGLEPAGVGARDLRESLLLQLDRAGQKKSLAYTLADKHLDELGRNRIPEVARACRVSHAQVYEAWNRIKQLQPRPGSAMGNGEPQYVSPEVTIGRDEEGRLQVSGNGDCMPHLRISQLYLRLLEDPATPAEVREYIREKVTNGNQLIRSLSQRRRTIERIAEVLVERQRDWFEEGEGSMRPLTMSEVAEELGVHETTVSRAIANKYVQTPRGLFPLRHFFGGGYEAEDGELLSNVSVKQKIRAMISEEDPHKPLSDKKLMESLQAEGLDVARRTVAKYREELGIPSSHRRKSHVPRK